MEQNLIFDAQYDEGLWSQKQPVSEYMLLCLCELLTDSSDLLVILYIAVILFSFGGVLRYDKVPWEVLPAGGGLFLSFINKKEGET